MPFSFIKKLEGKELTDEKIRDFKRLIIAQAGIIFSIFFLELSDSFKFGLHPQLAESLFFLGLDLYTACNFRAYA